MASTLEQRPPRPSAWELRRALPLMEEALGSPVWIVGGYVRDLLLGRPEAADVDLVLERADAAPAANWLRCHWRRTEPVVAFERYGTAQVSFALEEGGRFTVELVRARSEAYSPESRKPQVRSATVAEDVRRRDFTVNTLLLGSRGLIQDPTGMGLRDLRLGVLRTPLEPEATFSEDPLRMFRAARFAAQMGFRLADGLEEAMRLSSPRIRIVSVERVRDELIKLLLAPHPALGLRLLLGSGLLAETAPELAAMAGVAQGGYHLGDVFNHSALTAELVPPRRVLRLAALLHDVGKPLTVGSSDSGPTFYRHQQVGAEIARDLLRRLRLPGAEVDQVARLVELHMRPIQYRPEWADSAVRRLWHEAGELLPELLELARADTRASTFPGTAGLDELEIRLAEVARAHPQGLRAPVNGTQLRAWRQLPEGPWIGRALKLLVDATVAGDLGADGATSPEAAFLYLSGHR
ncbi:MAG: HD domain-containing protein, partial [Candidatus Dormiibacterota bacterium]